MEYTSRHLTSDPGMDQREALTALQTHPSFKEGSIVASIRNRNGSWVAEVLEPKTAEFPPKDEAPDSEGGDEGAPNDAGPPAPPDGGGDEGGEGGPPDGGDKKPEGDKGKEPKGEDAMLHILTQILHALTGGGAPDVAGGPDAIGPGGPPGGPPPPHGAGPAGPPPPHGGPPGAGGPPPGGPPKGPPPMKPGMAPPGTTPVGAPAFASVRAAGPMMPAQGTPVPQGMEAGPVGQQATAGICPQDGNPEPCPIHSPAGAGVAGLGGMVASFSGRAATITLTHEGSNVNAAIAEARPVVENFGYKVKQAKRSDDGTKVHILASRR